MRFLSLTNSNYKAIVDDEDYDRVMALNTKWFVMYKNKNPHSILSTKHFGLPSGLCNSIQLSRFVLNIQKEKSDIQADHIFGDIFDNRKSFIRKCTNKQNRFNSKIRVNSSTKHRGVSLDKRRNKYSAYVNFNGKRYSCGYFDTIEEASRARDKKAQELHGKFVSLNLKP